MEEKMPISVRDFIRRMTERSLRDGRRRGPGALRTSMYMIFWQSSEPVSSERIAGYQETVHREETAYQELFAEAMQKLLGDE